MDLGQPERLYLSFLPAQLRYPGLAILVVITTYLQSKLITPPSANPKDQSAQMAGIMNLYMPIFMGWLAYTLASGLALYFVVSNVFGIMQYAILGKADWRNLHSRPQTSPTGERCETDLKNYLPSLPKNLLKSLRKSRPPGGETQPRQK